MLWLAILITFCNILFSTLGGRPVFSCVKPTIPNANVYVKKGYGRFTIVVYCSHGYELLGRRRLLCQSGVYNLPIPKCIAQNCEIPEVEGGIIEQKLGGAVIHLSCRNGLVVDGNSDVYCEGKNWSRPIGQCKHPSDVRFCPFETPDLCGWTQDQDDDFDWTRYQGKTHTGRTGPTVDHTYSLSEKQGHYMYIESSEPRQEGDVARMRSPRFPALPPGSCFRFFYHMFGPSRGVGGLFVAIKYGNEREETLFERNDNQGNKWLEGHLHINDSYKNFQLIIWAVRGRHFMGDIAIDDLEILPCAEIVITDSSQLNTTSTVEYVSSPTSLSSIGFQTPSSSSPSTSTSFNPFFIQSTRQPLDMSTERASLHTNQGLFTSSFELLTSSGYKKPTSTQNSLINASKTSYGDTYGSNYPDKPSTTVTTSTPEKTSAALPKSTETSSGKLMTTDTIFRKATLTTLKDTSADIRNNNNIIVRPQSASKTGSGSAKTFTLQTGNDFDDKIVWATIGTALSALVVLVVVLIIVYIQHNKRAHLTYDTTHTAFNVTYRTSAI